MFFLGGSVALYESLSYHFFISISEKKNAKYITKHYTFCIGKQNGNQNLGTSMMKTLFLRFHNYIAFTLSSINPHWSDEILYQESRRIVIATIQRITYQDFLPIIIGIHRLHFRR